jgi:predicted DNA-binding helix-hairpin-helix protein
MEFKQRRMVEGLFLSSGISDNADNTMESIIKTIEILRMKYLFRGYIHAKMLPGASDDRIEAVCRLANRVSVNIEAPTAGHLKRLSIKKDLEGGILAPMKLAKSFKERHPLLVPAGQTTQFVVGAAGEKDADIIDTTAGLYRDIGLRRIYFSAYRPVGDPRLEGVNPASPWRQHRLYQADWLLRVYRFSYEEVTTALDEKGNLPLRMNPKLVIARARPWLYPVDVNTAGYGELLRVPGIGPLSARRIVDMRQVHEITSVEQLKKLRVRYREAMPFICFNGMLDYERQLCLDSMFPSEKHGSICTGSPSRENEFACC